MSKSDFPRNLQKKLDRLATIPKDYVWDEMTAVLKALGFKPRNSGGSHYTFYDPNDPARFLRLPRPHGRNPATMPDRYLKQTVARFEEWGFYDE